MAMRHNLIKAGYQVHIAEDGEQALKSACSDGPDIILLDMILPKLSGPDVLARLKQDPATAHIPVIVLTGLSKKNEQRLKTLGATAFMEKSQLADDPTALLNAIKGILKPNSATESFQPSLAKGPERGVAADL
jgi:two-component system cell cycle response regulator